MTEVILKKNQTLAIKTFLVSTLLVVFGIWIFTTNQYYIDDPILGLLWTGLFSIGIILGLFNFFDRRPQIIINENGIWDRSTKQDFIKWEQIKEAHILGVSSRRFISLDVEQSVAFKTKHDKGETKKSEGDGVNKLNIQFSRLKTDEVKLFDLINSMIKTERSNRNAIIRKYLE